MSTEPPAPAAEAGGDSIRLDDLRPQLVCTVRDPELGLLGHLVVDRTIGTNPSGGGIRLAPGLAVEEIAHLARSMTLKFAFLGFPTGGAKAGITAPEPLLLARRRDVMAAFGRGLAPLLRKRVYFLGEDLGTTLDDINAMLEAVGQQPSASDSESLQATALTVFAAIERCFEHVRRDLAGATVAIEGFGNVGSELASLVAARGARIVAVSTRDGAIGDPAGLAVDRLRELRLRHGDAFVRHAVDARPLDRDELPCLDVDLLVPCARAWTIHAGNADRVRARIIVPAANAPVTSAAAKSLAARGILYMPDFVANSGAVLRSRILGLGLHAHRVREVIDGVLSARMARLLAAAARRGCSPLELATEVAWSGFRRLADASRGAGGAARLRGGSILRSVRGRADRWLRRGIPALERARERAAFEELREGLSGEIDAGPDAPPIAPGTRPTGGAPVVR